MSDFDYKDHGRRQFRIWSIIVGAWGIIIICGLVAKYGNITDQNVAEVILFTSFASALVFFAGIYASFMAWVEKKLFQYKEKIDDDSS